MILLKLYSTTVLLAFQHARCGELSPNYHRDSSIIILIKSIIKLKNNLTGNNKFNGAFVFIVLFVSVT